MVGVFLFCERIDWRSVSLEGFGNILMVLRRYQYQTPKKASAALVHDLENWPSLTSKESDSSSDQGWWVGVLRLVHVFSRHTFKDISTRWVLPVQVSTLIKYQSPTQSLMNLNEFSFPAPGAAGTLTSRKREGTFCAVEFVNLGGLVV